MLLWTAFTVFGFSIAMTWYNSSKKKNDRIRKLKSIRKQIEDNERAKEEKNKKESAIEEKLNKFKSR